ncbi:hypothetical protein AVEN_142973-1 [Araneus ventricosus]|uniref:Uncharacterized protein n=1 Tax=Araneus ventricosus TaxID=182803 RepID=A0A4Y2NU50_ARAVE|nr:hypothetical protein AVEN_142973-1 [Araneus ventricosus]
MWGLQCPTNCCSGQIIHVFPTHCTAVTRLWYLDFITWVLWQLDYSNPQKGKSGTVIPTPAGIDPQIPSDPTPEQEPAGQIAHWIQRLQEYDFEIQHHKGTSHGNANALSRSCKHCTNAEKKLGMEIDISVKVLTTTTVDPWSSCEIQKAQLEQGGHSTGKPGKNREIYSKPGIFLF